MQTQAILRSARLSSQRARWVADLIRGKPVAQALDILRFSPQKAAFMMRKVLDSAIANAENNHSLDVDTLRVTRVCVDKAGVLRRSSARAKGRGNRISKQLAHIAVWVGDDQA